MSKKTQAKSASKSPTALTKSGAASGALKKIGAPSAKSAKGSSAKGSSKLNAKVNAAKLNAKVSSKLSSKLAKATPSLTALKRKKGKSVPVKSTVSKVAKPTRSPGTQAQGMVKQAAKPSKPLRALAAMAAKLTGKTSK